MTLSGDRNKVLFLFCLANCAISFNFAALAAVVPSMAADLRLSESVVSQVSAYYMIPYGLGALLYAPLSRKVSFKAILAAAMAAYGLLNFVCSQSSSVVVILAARVLMGLAAACVIPLCLISIGRVFEREVRGRMVGLFFSTSFAASVAGIMVSGTWNWRWLFIIPGVMGLVTALLIMLDREPVTLAEDEKAVDYLKVWRQRNIRHILLYIFILSLVYHGIHKWLAVYLHRQYDLGQWAISALFMLIAVTGAAGQNLGGFITDRKGRFFACYWGLVILAAAAMCLVGKYSMWTLAFILSVFSLGWTIGHNGISTVLTDFPDESRSEIAGLNSAIRFFSGGLGFFIGGPFVERNISLTFFGFGVVMLGLSFLLNRIIPEST